MFSRIGGFAAKHRVWVTAAWVLVAALMFFLAPSLSEAGSMEETTFLPADSESLRAYQLIDEYFPQTQAASSASLVFYNPEGLTDGDLAYARQVRDWLLSAQPTFEVENVTSIFDNPQLASRLVSPDDTTMLMNVGLAKAAFEYGYGEVTEALRSYLDEAPSGLEVYVSGEAGIYSDLFEALTRSIDLTTLITVLLVIFLLLLIYRSPVASLVPLITIGIAYLVSRGALGLIAAAGVSVWSQLDVFLIVLVFGVGTDYCLFMVSRFREELRRQESRFEAMKATVGRIGEVITASAFAVIVGLAGMAVAKYQMVQTMGPVLGVAIFITLLAALTLAPSLASLFGRHLFWPFQEQLKKADTSKKRQGFWERIAGLSTGRPKILIAVVVIIMLVPYLALPSLNRSFNQISELPADADSVAGFRILEEHYDIGEMEPLTAILVAPEGEDLSDPRALQALAEIGNDLRALDGVLKVQSIVHPDGTGETPSELTVSGQLTILREGLTTGLGGDGADPSLIFSGEIDQAFQQLNGYLTELSDGFDWVAGESSYQAAGMALQDIQSTIGEIRAAALVENQLKMIAGQIDQIAEAMSTPGAALPQAGAQSITLIQDYLAELAAKYPEVESETGYQRAMTALNDIQEFLTQLPTLTPQQIMAAMAKLPENINQISVTLAELAGTFSNRDDAYLLSETLSAAVGDTDITGVLQAQLANFDDQLRLLGTRFQERDNPYFLSSTLFDSFPEAGELLKLFLDEKNQATQMYLVLDSYPQSDRALTTVQEARVVLRSSLEKTALGGAEVAIGGSSAVLSDVRNILDTDFNRVMLVVIGGTFLVLLLLLRSLVAPIYLLMTVLLSYGTTLGIVSWIFQGIMGQDGVSFMIPIIVFVLLVALGSDYNIFLMSRIREESEERSTRDGARLAAIATGVVITACGIILAGTFGVLVVSPIRTMLQIGVAVAIGVLIDTFIVRALLVPAIATVLGRWNWWPSKRRY
jgi:RND superfamily putative drug exporter